MGTDAGHTGTPWRVEVYGFQGCSIYSSGATAAEQRICTMGGHRKDRRTNAAFIVEAVNSHASTQARIAELEGAVKSAIKYAEAQMIAEGQTREYAESCDVIVAGDDDLTKFNLREARAALASKEHETIISSQGSSQRS